MNTQQKIINVVRLFKESSSHFAKAYEELGWEAQEVVHNILDDEIKEKRDRPYIKAALDSKNPGAKARDE